jgi:hypothetical protein
LYGISVLNTVVPTSPAASSISCQVYIGFFPTVRTLSKMRTCCTVCCKILHWYCREIFLRTIHKRGVRKRVTFSALVEIWIFDLNGDLLITILALVLCEDLPIRACPPNLNFKPCLRSEIAVQYFFYCSHHERHRLNIYRQNVLKRSCW